MSSSNVKFELGHSGIWARALITLERTYCFLVSYKENLYFFVHFLCFLNVRFMYNIEKTIVFRKLVIFEWIQINLKHINLLTSSFFVFRSLQMAAVFNWLSGYLRTPFPFVLRSSWGWIHTTTTDRMIRTIRIIHIIIFDVIVILKWFVMRNISSIRYTYLQFVTSSFSTASSSSTSASSIDWSARMLRMVRFLGLRAVRFVSVSFTGCSVSFAFTSSPSSC